MSATEEIAAEQVETEQETGNVIEGDDGDLAGQPSAPDVEEPEARGETEAELEEKRKKLAASATTWRNRVSAVLGEEAQFLVPCELCEPDIPGFHFPAEVMQPTSETHARLLEVLKPPVEPEYKAAGDVARCIHCDGLGKVTTGSRNPAQRLKTCVPCNGFGYQPPPGTPAGAPAAAVTPGAGAPSAEGPAVVEDADAWGSPRLLADGQENPNYGRMPQYKDPALP